MVVGGFNVQTGERVPGTLRAPESELVRLGWDPQTAKRLSAMPEGQKVYLDEQGNELRAGGVYLDEQGEPVGPPPRPAGTIGPDTRNVVDRGLDTFADMGPIPGVLAGAARHAIGTTGDVLSLIPGITALAPERFRTEPLTPDERMGAGAAEFGENVAAWQGGTQAGLALGRKMLPGIVSRLPTLAKGVATIAPAVGAAGGGAMAGGGGAVVGTAIGQGVASGLRKWAANAIKRGRGAGRPATTAATPARGAGTAQDALRQELSARDIDWRTTDAVPIDAITRDITRPGGSIIEAGESRIGLGERLAEALKLAEQAKTPAAAEAALTEARRLAAAARQRMHIASKAAGGRGR